MGIMVCQICWGSFLKINQRQYINSSNAIASLIIRKQQLSTINLLPSRQQQPAPYPLHECSFIYIQYKQVDSKCKINYKQQIIMSLRIFTTDTSPLNELIQTLTHYFKDINENGNLSELANNKLFVNTKYYTCTIPIIISSVITIQPIPSQSQKTDMLILLLDENDIISQLPSKLTKIMKIYQPQSSIIVIQTQNNQQQWYYHKEIGQLDYCLPVIYENVKEFWKTRPERTYNGLLTQNQQQPQMFTLFQLIQTTAWSNLQKKCKQTHKSNIPSHQNIQQQQHRNLTQIKQQQHQIKQQNTSPLAAPVTQIPTPSQPNQQDLQSQMFQFQLLMQQMINIRQSSLESTTRKQRAQNLIMKLVKNINEQ